FKGRELTVEQACWHEVTAARCKAFGDQRTIPFQVNEPGIAAIPDNLPTFGRREPVPHHRHLLRRMKLAISCDATRNEQGDTLIFSQNSRACDQPEPSRLPRNRTGPLGPGPGE